MLLSTNADQQLNSFWYVSAFPRHPQLLLVALPLLFAFERGWRGCANGGLGGAVGGGGGDLGMKDRLVKDTGPGDGVCG